MKKTLSLIGFLLVLTAFTYRLKTEPSALEKLAIKLNNTERISYRYHLEINNIKDNYFSKDSSDCYFEFNKQAKLVSRLKADNKEYTQIYNGTEYFSLDKKEKTYQIDEDSSPQHFNSLIIMLHSIPVLMRCLDDVIANDSINKTEHDTVLAGKKYKVVSLSVPGKRLSYANKLQPLDAKIIMLYNLIIDPTTYLPYQVIENNNIEGKAYTVRTTFTNVNANPALPKANTWYYSSYENNYKRAKNKEAIPLIALGSTLPNIALPQMGNSTAALVMPAVKNKIVLLDFWIKNCGYCMESFPHLKELQAKYGQRNVQIVTVNAHDSRKEIDFFYKREKPAYPMLYQGQALAKKLGVDDRGYPTVLLTDTNGKIVYNGSFDKEKIERLIEKML